MTRPERETCESLRTVSETRFYGLLLSLGVSVVALAMLIWQWVEHRRRGPGQPEDAEYFARQHVRRGAVAVVLLLLAAGVFFGSRMESHREGKPNLRYIETWLGVFALILLLLLLALRDWFATRSYAFRKRSVIVREGLEILRDEIRLRRAHRGDGRVMDGTDRAADSP